MNQLNIDQGLPIREVSEDALAFLQTMHWPGNIRQLRNLIERVLILGVDKDSIKVTEFVSKEEKVPLKKLVLLYGSKFSSFTIARGQRKF